VIRFVSVTGPLRSVASLIHSFPALIPYASARPETSTMSGFILINVLLVSWLWYVVKNVFSNLFIGCTTHVEGTNLLVISTRVKRESQCDFETSRLRNFVISAVTRCHNAAVRATKLKNHFTSTNLRNFQIIRNLESF
jgi:hypothetical protein